MDGASVPGYPQIAVIDREAPDPVVVHLVILGKDNFNCILAKLEFAAETGYHIRQASHLNHGGALRRDHDDINGTPNPAELLF